MLYFIYLKCGIYFNKILAYLHVINFVLKFYVLWILKLHNGGAL